MALKTFKPYTKSTRGTILTSREGLWKGKPYKPLTSANYSSKGRNNYGRITSRNHGGGHIQKYRKIDFYLADLIIEYVSSVNPVVQIIKHRVEAEYVNIVSEIDKTSYPELIVSVNGVLKGDILTVE